jgi:hypothetical protein
VTVGRPWFDGDGRRTIHNTHACGLNEAVKHCARRGISNRNGPARGLVLRGAARPPEGGFAEGANSPVGKAIVSQIAHR